jgi:hypothetical protein
MAFPNLPSAMPHLQTGKLKALGVTSAKRSAAAPQIPSLAEAGVTDYEMSTWYGLIGPANMPAEVVRRLNRELRQVLADPATRSRLTLGIGALDSVDCPVEGIVQIVLDATTNCNIPVTLDRSIGWHAGLYCRVSDEPQVRYLTA